MTFPKLYLIIPKYVFLDCILLPDDAGKEDQDDGQEADPDGAHIERQCQP